MAFEKPYETFDLAFTQRAIRRANLAARGLPSFVIEVELSEPMRQWLGSFAGLEGAQSEDDRLLAKAVRELISIAMEAKPAS